MFQAAGEALQNGINIIFPEGITLLQHVDYTEHVNMLALPVKTRKKYDDGSGGT